MKKITAVLIFCITVSLLWAQQNENIPLKKVVILTSGLAYYEHSGSINGAVNINLPFRLDAVNDALKTLVLNDPATVNPSVTYQSENTLFQTLRSLMIDLSDDPGMAVILARLKGVEVEISSPSVYKGRIVGIEYRPSFIINMMENEPWLLLSTQEGMRPFNLKEIGSIKFTNQAIEQDLNRALDLIAASRNSFSRQLSVNLPGTARRDVTISYVIPSPVWKASYRLDLGASKPVFQGWAIVDNDSDTDWNNVSLSLVAGRPTSFIQNLYPPYYVSRPVLPLAIAGVAEAAVYDRGYVVTEKAEAEQSVMMRMAAPQVMMDSDSSYLYAAPSAAGNLTGGTMQTASGSDAGGQFEFTIKNPVSLDRRMSAMFPLVESSMEARKLLIYSGSGRYPRLGAELTNSSNMKLPAGPITVYDGGVYAGDALIEFWNEGEKRLISFGDDLSVTATSGTTSATAVNTVNISGGVMNITRRLTYSKTYTFVNSASVSKQLVVEHNKTSSTELVSPKADEQTASAYRFNVTLPAGRETTLTVNEQRPISERITLLPMRIETLLSYTTNQEIPANVRRALERAVELKRASDAADQAVKEIQAQRTSLISDQDRIRRNLEAAGNQTQQGQEYLRRLVALDNEIDAASANLERANAYLKTTQENYSNYLSGLNL
ncbi:MAG: DUF4139 domain-containing protein [Treponema sp.]|nr:DUF4139 domain-containing protein [Treponema sp.]MCL2272003.1 DUF4139 domain-containing protein [Treponema sp.]